MKTVNDYLNENMINNIFEQYNNVFIIQYEEETKKDDKYIGKLLLKVNIKKDKSYIKINDIVEFRSDKIKWKSNEICLIDPYWVKLFLNNTKLEVEVEVLKSKIQNGERKYYNDTEFLYMNYKQFITRRFLEEYREVDNYIIEAFRNFSKRKNEVGYYQALNETSKHYRIKHDDLKNTIIPKINHSLKKYKKEWNELYKKYLENNFAMKKVEELIDENKSKNNNVIPFKKEN